MQKLILILLAFLALFTIIGAFGESQTTQEAAVSIENLAQPVEIVQ